MTNHHDIPQQRQHSPEQQVRGREVRGREVRALWIDTDGHLTELVYRGHEHHVLREPLEVRAGNAPGGVGIETLDEDLVMWFDEYGAEHQPVNPVASVLVAAFGRAGHQVFGPVVIAGWTDTGGILGGRVADIGAAATILRAGMAASCDPCVIGSEVGTEHSRTRGSARSAERAMEWTGLGIEIEHGPGAESFDSLAWTITRDGDVARCVECGEPGSHEEHQPEALAESHEQTIQQVARIRVAG